MPVMFVVPGNHEYVESRTTQRVPEFYFRFPRAGAPELGWLALSRGGWRLLGYNTELNRRDRETHLFLDREKALGQLAWLEEELRRYHTTHCILAFGHRPGFSSGRHGSYAYVRPIFNKLYPGFPISPWYLNGLTTRGAFIHTGCDAMKATTEVTPSG